MPRDGAGGYNLPGGNPVVTGTTISSTAFNNTTTDIGTALAGSIASDGQTPWSGNQNANGNKIVSLGAPSASSDAARMADTVGRLLGVQIFTSSGTYTPTVGTTSVVVEVQAPGGGSGGCAAITSGQWAAASSGSGGGYGLKRITSGFSGVTVTVGAAGAAGAAGNNNGGAGGTTSFGATVSCTGGAGGGGGAAQTPPGIGIGGTQTNPSGGIATGADVSVPGGAGDNSFSISASWAVRGGGGKSFLGSGGAPGSALNSNLSAASGVGYGGGASGPLAINGILGTQAGAAGAPGVVIVWEYA